MKKDEFLKELASVTNYSEEKCLMINEILEHNFVISKKNKDVIVKELKSKLDISDAEAENVYNSAVDIIKREVKNSLKHPFKSKD